MLRRLREERLPVGTKGLPLDGRTHSVDSAAGAAWNLLRGDLPFPLVTLAAGARIGRT
jgi:hypothetical protein